MITQVAQDLRAAAEVLRRDGWTQGRYTDPVTGCHCVTGAIAGAVPDFDSGQDRWRVVVDSFGTHIGVGPNPIAVYLWNDAPERTADEVVAALEAAADAAEATP